MKVLTLILAAAAVLLCSCSEDRQTDKPREQVYYSHYWSFAGNARSGMDEAVARYNRESRNYELVPSALDHEAFKTAIKAELNAGRPSDIYSYWAGMRTAALAGKLQPLDELWEKEKLDQRFSPALVKSAATYDGHRYLLPVTQHLVAVIYNKKLFARLGLTPPKTWDEFLAVCRAVKAGGVTPLALGARNKWPAQFWFDYLLLRTAGPDYRHRLMAGQARYTDAEVVKAFTLWKELLDNGFFNPDPNGTDWETEAGGMLVHGRAAMTLMGSWLFGYLSSDKAGWVAGEDYDVFPFPAIDPSQPDVALGPVDGLVVPRDARNKAGALDVLRYFARLDTQLLISSFGGNIVPLSGVSPESYAGAQRIILPIIRHSEGWAFNYDLATRPEAAELGLNALAEFLAFPDLMPQILQKLDARTGSLPHD